MPSEFGIGRVNETVNGRSGITPSTAFLLAQFYGTSSESWLNRRMRWYLYQLSERSRKN
jgi:plasmid maintenance system antidote protein VapI